VNRGGWLDNNDIESTNKKTNVELTLFCRLSSCPGKCLFEDERGLKILEIAPEIVLLPVGEVARVDGINILEG
jgi:hypothetical protein